MATCTITFEKLILDSAIPGKLAHCIFVVYNAEREVLS
jgi:hypothetical protein